jgi:lipoprotein-releasing system permease protein
MEGRMYKLLLSWKYLRTRFLAMASVVSVMLGVATLIVVNSVMGGFANKLMNRVRGYNSDILIEYRSQDGMRRLDLHLALVKEVLKDSCVAISPVIETYGMLQFRLSGDRDVITRPVRIIGVEGKTKAQTGEFAQTLLNPEHKQNPDLAFTVRGAVERKHDHFYPRNAKPRGLPAFAPAPAPGEPPPPEAAVPPPEEMRYFGVVLGFGIANVRDPKAKVTDDVKDICIIELGHEVTLTMVSNNDIEGHDGSSSGARPVNAKFVVTDYSRSEMGEMDGNIVYVDIKDLQRLRSMQNRATSLHIRLRDFDRDHVEALKLLHEKLPPDLYVVTTWKEKQGPILAAIAIERAILNILLFLIIAVAGFGILAIFFMIVVEKTRDIGILKALGASNKGVMGIFLGYGLTLGLVGAGLGTALGITIVVYINDIEKFLTEWTGQQVFDRSIYYFDKIPTEIDPWTVLLVNAGALLIAVGSSVLPALRAAMLHPVQALRYE